ncbi:MAG: hypothetical protein AAGC73_00870 [Verrucomicrobiota bacterium]
MKHLLCLLASLPLFALASEISLGDSLESTLEKLGTPVGTIELRDKSLLLYPQGEVTLKQDVVTHIDLMTPEEFAADQARMQQEREEWQMHQEKRKAAHLAEGKALMADRLSSQTFARLPAKDKVDFWRRFQARYPDVEASTELARALEGYELELAELLKQQQIAELEARVARAEKEATQAKLETERLREEAEAQRSRTQYGLRYYTDPVYSPRYHYKPPTITIYSNGNVTKEPKRQFHWEKSNPRSWERSHQYQSSTSQRVTRIIQQKQAQ